MTYFLNDLIVAAAYATGSIFFLPLVFGFIKSFLERISSYRKALSRSKLDQVIFFALITAPLALISRARDAWYSHFGSIKVGQFEAPLIQAPTVPPSSIIIWIHGTWQKDTAQPGTLLLDQIKSHFPDSKIIKVGWHAPNTQQARNWAAGKLAALCQENFDMHGDIPMYLIGHSHGGFVAYLAASQLNSKPIKVISLATPFVELIIPNDPDQVPSRTLNANEAATHLFMWPFFLIILSICWLWSKYGIVLMPYGGLITRSMAMTMSLGLIGAISAFLLTFVPAILFDRQIKGYLNSVVSLNRIVAHRPPLGLIAIRLKNDPLLNLMFTFDRLHRMHCATNALKKVRACKSDVKPRISDGAELFLRLAIFAAYAHYFLGPLFAIVYRLTLPIKFLSLSVQTAGYAAFSVVVFVPFLFSWICPGRILIAMGKFMASVLANGFFTMVILAQSLISGLSPIALLRGFIRISDSPRGTRVILGKSTYVTDASYILKRHTQILEEPDVLARVIEACRQERGRACLSANSSLHGTK